MLSDAAAAASPPAAHVETSWHDTRPASPTLHGARGKGVLLRRAAEETMGEIEGLQGGVDMLQNAIQNHADTLAMYKQQLRRTEDDLREARQEMKVMAAELEQAQAAAKAAEDGLHHAEVERRKAFAQVATVDESSSLKDMRITDLQARLEAAERELLISNQRANTADSEISDLRRRLMASDATAAAANAKADSQNAQLVSLQQQLQDAAHQAAALERRAAEQSHAKAELHSQVKRMECAHEQLSNKVVRYEASIAELRREQQEATRYKVSLDEATRQLHTLQASKQRADAELVKSEEAHAMALNDLAVLERLRGECDMLKRNHDIVVQKLEISEGRCSQLERELAGVAEVTAATEKRASGLEGEVTVLQERLLDQTHRTAVLESTAGLREQDVAEIAALREESLRYKRECEELAAGVERLHRQAEAERVRRVELEAFQAELMAQRTYSDTMNQVHTQEERALLERQLAQIATTLDMLWKEFSPYILAGSIRPGEPPLDGQLAEMAYRGTRLLKGAQEIGARLRSVVVKYMGVLGDRARKTAEAAMLADATHDTDDFDVSIQVLGMILDKLLADISNARLIIEDQNKAVSQSRASVSMDVGHVRVVDDVKAFSQSRASVDVGASHARYLLDEQNKTFSQSRASVSHSRSPYSVHAPVPLL